MKTTATQSNGTITIKGYFDNGVIVSTGKRLRADLSSDTSIDERELNNVIAALESTLNVSGHDELCKAIGNDNVEIDFFNLDFEDIAYDLKSNDEAKINITGESSEKIEKIIESLKANLIFDEIDIFNNSKNGQKYIYLYA